MCDGMAAIKDHLKKIQHKFAAKKIEKYIGGAQVLIEMIIFHSSRLFENRIPSREWCYKM